MPKSHLHQIRKDLPRIRVEAWNTVNNLLREHMYRRSVPRTLPEEIVEAVLKAAGIVCQEPDCDRPMKARGYCGKHHRQHFRKEQK